MSAFLLFQGWTLISVCGLTSAVSEVQLCSSQFLEEIKSVNLSHSEQDFTLCLAT